MKLELDRMLVEDVGGNPDKLADAIHDQLGDLEGAVPVHDIARALDIDEIREEPLTSFEGALITTVGKNRGAIVVNSRSSPQRRRYTVGHELGHFLNSWHKPTTPSGFECTRADMVVSSGESGHLKQEAEANRFAIALLAPAQRLSQFLSGSADLQSALAIAAAFDISEEAAVRRYVELHDETLAVVFSRNNTVRYVDRPDGFPFLSVWNGDRLPILPRSRSHSTQPAWDDADARDWLKAAKGHELYAQTLWQSDAYAITLLRTDTEDDDADDAELRFRFR